MSNLAWLFQSSQNIVLIDWICVGDNVFVVVLDRNTRPTMQRLPFSVRWLEEWVKTHIPASLHTPETDSPRRLLDNLIGPLGSVIQLGSVLILSPSGPLHSIPLQALRLSNGKILIEQHPRSQFIDSSSMHYAI
jgi:hypothetical protein